jgi:hypothetical protein
MKKATNDGPFIDPTRSLAGQRAKQSLCTLSLASRCLLSLTFVKEGEHKVELLGTTVPSIHSLRDQTNSLKQRSLQRCRHQQQHGRTLSSVVGGSSFNQRKEKKKTEGGLQFKQRD